MSTGEVIGEAGGNVATRAAGGVSDGEEAGGNEASTRLGYCPTMEAHALRIAAKTGGVVSQRFASAAAALQGLASNQSEMVLIGRLARNTETNNQVIEVRLSTGYTLVRKVAGFIEYAELAQLRIHTAVDSAVSTRLLPAGTTIRFHANVGEAMREGLDEAVLIDWNDFSDDHQLLIPVQNGNKVAAFRLPTLYHQRELAPEKVQEIVRAYGGK